MQEIIIIAGLNGAGKTSFADKYLPSTTNKLEFVNADEIAREVTSAGLMEAAVNLRASREMLSRIDELVATRREFMFETTLASRTYARKITHWQQAGYSVALIYLRLPSVEHSMERVARRVAAGGHGIPEPTIRRRFDKSLVYLEKFYKPIVDEWYIYDSLEGDFQLAEAWDDR